MQTRIFSSTLEQLLSTSRLRVLFGPSQRTWKPGELKQLIAQQDCVVLVAPSADELELARHGARALVDVRDHVVDPARIQPAAFRPWNSPDDPSIAAIYTGIVPVVYKARHTLLRNLIESTFWSFVTITPIMMLVSRSIAAGGIAMLPNVLPVLVVFGGMGWLGIVVDIGSMMTAGIALGVAVDDTIHYLNWFREELNRSGDRKQAILAAYRHCATPTLQAAVISGLGLAIFAVSPFTPTRRFGYLMLTILWLGLAAELLFFPALLAGPLGRAFQPRRGRRGPAREITQAGESPGVP